VRFLWKGVQIYAINSATSAPWRLHQAKDFAKHRFGSFRPYFSFSKKSFARSGNKIAVECKAFPLERRETYAILLRGRSPGLRRAKPCSLASSLAVTKVHLALTVAGAVTDFHRLPDYPNFRWAPCDNNISQLAPFCKTKNNLLWLTREKYTIFFIIKIMARVIDFAKL